MVNLKLALRTFLSKRRMMVLKVLGVPLTPTQVAKRVKQFYPEMTTNHCSDALRWLAENGLVKCSNGWDRKGRIYVLLKEGEEIRNEMLKNNLI